jgi:hypothetical protein
MREKTQPYICPEEPEKTEIEVEAQLSLDLATLPQEVEESEKIASLRLEPNGEKTTTDLEELEAQARAAARKVLHSIVSWQSEYLRVTKF